jgi:hypothetical protein
MNNTFVQLHIPQEEQRKIEEGDAIKCNMSHKISLYFILFQTIQNTALGGVCLATRSACHKPNSLSTKHHWLESKLPF